jgi:hypothetical protein
MTISTTTLKNAARAIECDLWTDSDGANYLAKDGAILRRWEPATSSVDSLDLMAALNMNVASVDGGYFIDAELYKFRRLHRGCCDHSADRAQDYRTAIVLCASAFGETLKCQ